LPIAKQLLTIQKGLLAKNSSLKNSKNYFEGMALYYQKMGNAAEALAYWKKQQAATDSLNVIEDAGNYSHIQQKIETEKHLVDIKTLEARTQIALLKRNLFIVILALLMAVSLLVYNRTRIKQKAQKELFLKQEELLKSEKLRAEAEQLRAEGELQGAKALLQNYTENIRQKNALIDRFTAELVKLQGEPDITTNFEKLVQSTILTDADWEAFRNLFEKVYKGFFFNLKNTFPNLSITDTRLLCLIKLQLSNREMANMLGISIDAIKKAKQRLKKKINLETELEDMIQSI
jgi:hypothetical protein